MEDLALALAPLILIPADFAHGSAMSTSRTSPIKGWGLRWS